MTIQSYIFVNSTWFWDDIDVAFYNKYAKQRDGDFSNPLLLHSRDGMRNLERVHLRQYSPNIDGRICQSVGIMAINNLAGVTASDFVEHYFKKLVKNDKWSSYPHDLIGFVRDENTTILLYSDGKVKTDEK